MHQPVDDEAYREDDGFLRTWDGRAIFEATCEDCFEYASMSRLQFLLGKWRCGRCAKFETAELKRKPTIYSAITRARQAGVPATLTEKQWEGTLAHFKRVCAYCDDEAWRHVEHATPIQRGGGTTVDNCLPACPSCNVQKKSMTLEEFVVATPIAAKDKLRKRIAALEWLRANGRS